MTRSAMSTEEALRAEVPEGRIGSASALWSCNGAHLPEAEIKDRMASAARRVLLTGGRKVGVVELARVCDIDQVDTLIAGRLADEGVVEPARVCDIDRVATLVPDTLPDHVVARIREVSVDVTVLPAPAA